MNKNLDKQLAQVFENDYCGYEYFVEKVINVIFTGDDAYEALTIPEEYLSDEKRQKAKESGILKILKVGEIDAPVPIEVFDITLSDDKDLQYNRVGIQSFIRSDLFMFTKAFMLFHNENPEGKDWRFSFAYKDTTIKGMTPAKRYTYLFGKNHRARTASERFAKLADAEKDTQNLLNAFSVEALSKDFFNGYKEQYKAFCDFLFAHKDDREYFGPKFSQWEDKYLRDYVKKMMGRITFIYFLQRKGWMNNDLDYMQKAFENSTCKDDYLDSFLEPLFCGVLNTKPEERAELFKSLGWNLSLLDGWNDIPYLNGGLFERDEQDKPKSKFPAQMFKNLFDFYSRYNFTIYENDPDDAEVGIDPEMLGHIFENLLEDNKDKGAFYTPKEIVQYMSRESIAQYLKTHADEELHTAIDELIKDGKVGEALQDKANATAIYRLLCDVKVCDPAIGSGAFPMGVLNVLYHARMLLYAFTRPTQGFSPAMVKREIIQNNIYGVDIEKGAVDIARLRFWLALVVDEEEPQPLPNLDYKIMCGNSQICRFKLDMPISEVFEEYNRVGKENAKKNNSVWNNFSLNDYRKLVIDYTDEYNNKSSLKSKINDIKNCFKTTLAKGDINKRKQIEKKVNDYESVTLFGKRKADEDPSGYANAKAILRRLKEKESEILNNKKYEYSFEWRFEYPQLLDNDGNFIGFDIVLANPPYIKEGRMSKLFFEPYKDSPYYKGKMDIWYLFACNGLDLLNENGILCFIATNNWVTSFGASKLRNKVIKETRICNIVDFGAVMMFESASIQTMIMLFQKDSITDDYSFDYRRLTAYRATEKDAAAILSKTAKDAEYFSPTIRRANFIDKNITFSRSADILDQIVNLKDVIYLYDKEIAQGIVFPQDRLNKKNQQKLGANYYVGQGVFVLTDEEKDALMLDSNELSLVMPYYTSENVERYVVYPSNYYWAIYTDSRFKHSDSLNDYPKIKAHLDRFLSIMTSDNKPYGLHRAREERFFTKEKIVVLRKCVEHPVFSYCNFDCYLSQSFNMIQTDRVNMKYLTGLLNSRLIEFWLKNKGKMQGANYQLDKEPLMQIPIAVPDRETQELIAKLVDIIILLKSSKQRASNLVTNDYLANEFSHIIDGCVYEIYFPNEMLSLDLSIAPQLLTQTEGHPIDLESVWQLYSAIDKSGIIESIKSLSLSKSEVLRTISLS